MKALTADEAAALIRKMHAGDMPRAKTVQKKAGTAKKLLSA